MFRAVLLIFTCLASTTWGQATTGPCECFGYLAFSGQEVLIDGSTAVSDMDCSTTIDCSNICKRWLLASTNGGSICEPGPGSLISLGDMACFVAGEDVINGEIKLYSQLCEVRQPDTINLDPVYCSGGHFLGPCSATTIGKI